MTMSDEEMGDERHRITRFRNSVHVTQSDKIEIQRIIGMNLHEFLKKLVQGAVAKACNIPSEEIKTAREQLEKK